MIDTNQNSLNFVICGQALTGRLEVLENCFRKRFKNLFVIGISSVFAYCNAARCTFYENGEKKIEKKLFNILIRQNSKIKAFLFPLAYIQYFNSAFLSVLHFRSYKKELVFVGIGCFPAVLGIFFRKIGIVKKTVYYSIDYFPPLNKTFNDKVFVLLDKFCAKKSDLVWIISAKILDARKKFANLKPGQYKSILAPLTFDESLLKFRDEKEVERWSIVFVGTSGYFHGLHILIEAMPVLVRLFPQIKVKIIGPGPWDDTKKEIERLNLTGYFDFLGFIEDEVELFDTVSRFALGLALYVPVENNPTFYADPGKPKLYAFCSVPVVISRTPLVSKEIDSC
jgi:glycosyltransferase involved in cell wall biosynthesis